MKTNPYAELTEHETAIACCLSEKPESMYESPTTRIAGGLRKAPKRGYWLFEIKFVLTFIKFFLIFHRFTNRFLIKSNCTDTVPS